MKINKPQKRLKQQLKELKQYINENNINIYYCDEANISSYLSNLGFILIQKEHKEQKYRKDKAKKENNDPYISYHFFHEAGLTLTAEFDSLFKDQSNYLTATHLYFIGNKLKFNNCFSGSGGTCANIYGLPMEVKNMKSHTNTSSDFISDLEKVVNHFNLYQKPIQGLEFYFADAINLFKNQEELNQLQNDPIIGDTINQYMNNFTINQNNPKSNKSRQGKTSQLTKQSTQSWNRNKTQAGNNNHFSINAMKTEMMTGFLGQLMHSRHIYDKNYRELSKTEQQFLEQAFQLTTGQKTINDIDPEWLNFQVEDSINFLSYIAGVRNFDSRIQTLFQDVVNTIDYYYDRQTVQNLLFSNLNYQDKTNNLEQKSNTENIDNNQENLDSTLKQAFDQSLLYNLLDCNEDYFPYIFKSINTVLPYIEPEDLLRPLSDTSRFESNNYGVDKEQKSLDYILMKVNQFSMLKLKVNNKSENDQIINQFLDQLAQKIYENQHVIDHFKHFNQKTTDWNMEGKQINVYINNTIQSLILKDGITNNQNNSNSINPDMTNKKPAKPML